MDSCWHCQLSKSQRFELQNIFIECVYLTKAKDTKYEQCLTEMEELIKSGKIKMIFKGEDGEEVNLFDSEDPLPEVKVRLGVRLSDNNGVIIERFEGNSVLEGAGLEIGDQITEINDFYIADYKGLLNELAKYNPGDKVSIRYIREGKAQTVNVKLAGKE